MNRAKNTGLVLCGLVLGLSLSAPAAQAVESLKATLSTNRILVDGQEVRLTAYNINGNNYVMLRVNDKLMQAAQVRADEMASSSVYSHTRPDGRRNTSVTDCPYVGENIHRIADWALQGKSVSEAAVWSWNLSGGHRDNLLEKNYAETGVGLSRGVNDSGEACWYCVQLFLWNGYSISWVDTPAAK